ASAGAARSRRTRPRRDAAHAHRRRTRGMRRGAPTAHDGRRGHRSL
ncbi:MAG: hypothetical protein AVDCRST_MAG85-4219, partial [uncultured Solirubrobacteraceae bacterium]